MSVKRTRDPARLLPDQTNVTLDGDPNDRQAVVGIFQSAATSTRIERLRRHEALRAKADELAQWYEDARRHPPAALLAAVAGAETLAMYLDAAPKVIRDNTLQASKRKPRGAKMPELDKWLDAQNLDVTNAALFESLPKPSDNVDVYRDGGRAVEIRRNGKEHATGFSGFKDRAAAARKRRR